MLDTERGTEEPAKDWERARAFNFSAFRRTSFSQRVKHLIAPKSYLRRRDRKLAALARHPLMAGSTRAERRFFARYSDEIECAPGDILVKQGFISHWFFMIVDGVSDVIQNGHVSRRLHGGDYFGELAFFGGGSHSATVRASTNLKLLVVHRRHFAVLIDQIPSLRRELMASMTARLRAAAAALDLEPTVLSPGLLADTHSRPRWVIAKSRRIAARLRRFGWATAIIAVGGLLLVNYHPPVAVVAPGPTFDISKDIVITGVPNGALNGEYLLTSIRIERPNVVGLLMAAVRADREIVAIPRAEDLGWVRTQQRILFNESRLLAAAAAAKNQGMQVSLSGSGAVITGLIPESPAAPLLRRGDVIVGVDDQIVGVSADAGRFISSHGSGPFIKLEIERQGAKSVVEVPVDRSDRNSETTLAIGAFVRTRGLEVQLPFEVEFRKRDIGGPSAGLIYALAISDMLNSVDYAKGRTIAATGTINADGHVGAVGAVRYKGESSRHAGAWIFFVPSALVDETSGQPLLVFGIDSLVDALTALVESQI